MPLSTTNLSALQASDRAHHLHPFTDFKALGEAGTRVIARGEGVYIYDTDGKRLLDGMSGLWNVNVGYGRRELIEAATAQLETLPYYNSFFQCTTEPTIALAERLAGISGMSHVFFAGSGSEANDTQLRIARRYWQIVGQPGKQIVISRKNAYHGSTLGAASLGGMKDMHKQGGLPIPGIEHVDQPYYFEADTNETPDAFGVRIAEELDARIGELGAENVAAFIGEPVQGAGGVVIPPATYWPAVQAVCQKHDVLLIADEVITGFGRLGEWFAYQRMGFQPDLVTFAKGVTSGYVPLGGVLVGERVSSVLTESGGEFAHGYTYSGHPVACAVGLANVGVIESDDLVGHVRNDIEPYFTKAWSELGEQHAIVGEARMLGLMGALELVEAPGKRFDKDLKVGERCRDLAIEHGLVMRAVGDTLIIAPPLVITRDEVDELVGIADRVLAEVVPK